MIAAYVHAKPDGAVFYVGKGTGRRLSRIDRKNKWHKNILEKYGKENILVGIIPCSTEQIALDLEIGLIKCFRRAGADLVNVLPGGTGTTGYKHTEETRKHLSDLMKGRPSYVLGKKFKCKYKKAPRFTEAQRAASAERLSKFNKSRAGMPVSIEKKAKISKALTGRVATNRKRVMRGDGVVYESIHAAALANKTTVANVSYAINGKQKKAAGYTWAVLDASQCEARLNDAIVDVSQLLHLQQWVRQHGEIGK